MGLSQSGAKHFCLGSFLHAVNTVGEGAQFALSDQITAAGSGAWLRALLQLTVIITAETKIADNHLIFKKIMVPQ